MTWTITLRESGGDDILTWSAANEQDAEQIVDEVNGWLNSQQSGALGLEDPYLAVNVVPSKHLPSPADAIQEIHQTFGGVLKPSEVCRHCQQQIDVVNGLLKTHDIGGGMRQVCPGSGAPAAILNTLSQMGLPTNVQLQNPAAGWAGVLPTGPTPEELAAQEEAKEKKRQEQEMLAALEKQRQVEFDAEMAEKHPTGLYLVVGPTDAPIILDYKEGVALEFAIKRRALHLRYNQEDPTDPSGGTWTLVDVFINGKRRKGKPSEIATEVREALSRVDMQTLGEHGGSRKLALKYKEQYDRLQRIHQVEATDEIPDDVAAILARLQGGKAEAPKGPTTHTMTITPEAMEALSKTETCDCCGEERLSLPYHHDAHDDSGDSWDYCQKCYDAGCSVNDPTGGCAL